MTLFSEEPSHRWAECRSSGPLSWLIVARDCRDTVRRCRLAAEIGD